jgi:hypothetical protein
MDDKMKVGMRSEIILFVSFASYSIRYSTISFALIRFSLLNCYTKETRAARKMKIINGT